MRVSGHRYGFIETLACPPGALVPVRGVFSFRGGELDDDRLVHRLRAQIGSERQQARAEGGSAMTGTGDEIDGWIARLRAIPDAERDFAVAREQAEREFGFDAARARTSWSRAGCRTRAATTDRCCGRPTCSTSACGSAARASTRAC